MQTYEILYWVGTISLSTAALLASIIQVRRSIKFGSVFQWFKPLESTDTTLAGVAGILFLISIILFIAGAYIRK